MIGYLKVFAKIVKCNNEKYQVYLISLILNKNK